MKICTKCGVGKHPDAFRRGRNACRSCESLYTKEWLREKLLENPDHWMRYASVVECPGCGLVRQVRNEHMKRACFTGMCVRCARISARGGTLPRDALPVLHPRPDVRVSVRWRRAEAKLFAAPPEPRWFTAGRCAGCPEQFVALGRGGRYCSDGCALKAKRGRRKRPVSAAERLAIYERDRWVCQHCRKRVGWTKAVPHPKAPTLDHVIPRSQGGSDDPANLQCAHFMCNVDKGIGTIDRGEQLRLIA